MTDRMALAEHRILTLDRMFERAERMMQTAYRAGDHTTGAIYREEVDALTHVLAALRTDTDPSLERVEAMREACLSVVDNIRTNYRPVLNKPRYQAHEIKQFFTGACSLIDEDIRALPVTNEGAGSC